jgi:imidazolonepropionase-like amidohydrolase
MSRLQSVAIPVVLSLRRGGSRVAAGLLLACALVAVPLEAQRSDTVHVAPPTGEAKTDRASIVAALDEVEPAGTVQFAPGTYLIGEAIRVSIPRITLLGHPEGTTLRGCEPAAFEDREVAIAGCNGFTLTGGHQTVRHLTFEHTWHALAIGCAPGGCRPGTPPLEARAGGYRVEENIFRETPNGIRVFGQWSEPAVIRDNRFVNTYHAVVINGMTAHVLDNRISVPAPGRVPNDRHPGGALAITAWGELDVPGCSGNVIAGNRIEGHPQAVVIMALPESACRGNVIRDNAIQVSSIRFTFPTTAIQVRDEADSTAVASPIVLRRADPETIGLESPTVGEPADGVVEENLIEGNRISGASGLAVEILGASENRIVGNTITGVTRRDPFPGNTFFAEAPQWSQANGSGVWISPDSDGNEIVGNTFEDVAAVAVFLEGDDNRVKLRSASDAVRDLGTGNRVIGLSPSELEPWPAYASPDDTIRYVGIVNGMTGGERLLWRAGPDAWGYRYDMGRSGFPRTERLRLEDDGLPVRLEVSGQKAPWDPWEERFEHHDDTARWTTTVDEGEQGVEGPTFYAALHPAHDLGVIARALLRRPDRRLALLPGGEARLQALGQRTVEAAGQTRTVRHYAVRGLDLKPAYVWLDQNGATFADEWTIRAGWESVFPELKDASRAALADHVRGLTRRSMPPRRDRPLAIRGARLFDPTDGSVRTGTTIVVEGNRVAAVGEDGGVPVPEGADMIDAAGRTVLPGLWDMHAHHGTSLIDFFRYRELDALLHLAGGVTTARDLGSHVDELLSLRQRIESGEAIGPRLLAAGYIDGVGGSRTGVYVGTPEEARTAVDRFAELGYAQIKIYEQLPAELVRAVIERADRHGLRVSGHVPRGMSARQAVEAGFDELQHVQIVVGGILGSRDELSVRWEDDWEGWADAEAALQPGSSAVRDFVELLAARNVALDPTLALALASEVPPHYVAPVLDRFPPQARRRLLDRFWSVPPPAEARRDAYVASWKGFVRAAHEAGVQILPGTDLLPGFGLHRELELYVMAGIPAREVLTLATLGAAREMGMDDQLGSVEPGKLADLILVDGDPTVDMSDIRRVEAVIKKGRVYDPAAIYHALGIAEQAPERVERSGRIEEEHP